MRIVPTRVKGGTVRRFIIGAAALAAVAALGGAALAAGGSRSGNVTLTLWHKARKSVV